MTARRVLCLASCAVDAVYKELCERLKLRKNDCSYIVDAVLSITGIKAQLSARSKARNAYSIKISVLNSST